MTVEYDIFSECCDAFEAVGCCGHDLGGQGLMAILKRYEEIRLRPGVIEAVKNYSDTEHFKKFLDKLSKQ